MTIILASYLVAMIACLVLVLAMFHSYPREDER
jgi:hypothetical protein